MKIALERRYRFSASHLYRRPDWSEAENRARFGKCANLPGHGHNYRLYVTVGGEIDPATGFVVDLGALDAARPGARDRAAGPPAPQRRAAGIRGRGSDPFQREPRPLDPPAARGPAAGRQPPGQSSAWKKTRTSPPSGPPAEGGSGPPRG